jgi:hypothetical protein
MALKPEELTAFRKTFFPPGYVTPPPAAGAARQQPPKPAAQNMHPLNIYGFHLVHLIEKEYNEQVGNWKTVFGNVVTCLAGAITRKTNVLKDAQAEREADAAFHAMIISFMAIGPMSFLGAYVEHTVIPRLTKLIHTNDPLIMGLNTGSPFIVKSTKVVSVQRFSALQADAFGGIAQGIGNQLLPLTFPKPVNMNFQLDSSARVELLRNEFLRLIEDSAKVVITQFTNVQTWMNENNEFGEAWTKSGGADPKARIRLHFDGLRNEWAKQWKFFGTDPVPIATQTLTDTIERALWAGHLARVFSDPRFTTKPDPMSVKDRLGGRGAARAKSPEDVGGKALENAVLDRLKLLNIVNEETFEGKLDQFKREMNVGAPHATVGIEDEVDRRSEVDRLRAWAQDYLNKLDREATTRFFPPAMSRVIAPIQYF